MHEEYAFRVYATLIARSILGSMIRGVPGMEAPLPIGRIDTLMGVGWSKHGNFGPTEGVRNGMLKMISGDYESNIQKKICTKVVVSS